MSSLNPLWDRDPDVGLEQLTAIGDEDITIPRHGHHRTLTTSVLDADRVDVQTMASPSYWPFVVAGMGLVISVSIMVQSWLLGCAATLVLAFALVSWHAEVEELKE